MFPWYARRASITSKMVTGPEKIVRFGHHITSNTALLVYIIAFLVRLSLVVFFPDLASESPDRLRRYDRIALSLARGEGLSIRGEPTAVAAPIYPFVLSIIYALFGYSTIVLRIFLSLIDAGHCLLFYLIARKYFGEKIPILTAIMLIFSPYTIYAIFTTNVETLFLFLHALFILYFSDSLQEKIPWKFLISGLLLGVATLCRAVPLLLPVFFLPVFVILYKDNIKSGLFYFAIFLFGFIFSITPWIVRNYLVFHRFVPIQTLGGYHLYIAGLKKNDYVDFSRNHERLKESDFSDVARDNLYYWESFKKIKENPMNFVKLMAERLFTMWHKTHSEKYDNLLIFLNSILLISAFTGIFINCQRWRSTVHLLIIVLYYINLHMIFIVIFRYILQVIPILIIFAMIPLNELLNRRVV